MPSRPILDSNVSRTHVRTDGRPFETIIEKSLERVALKHGILVFAITGNWLMLSSFHGCVRVKLDLRFANGVRPRPDPGAAGWRGDK